VASRRVDFHLQKHSFSKWKYRQVDLFLAASVAIRDILVHDGIAADRVIVVHDGIDVGKIGRLPVADIHAEFWLPHGAPVLVNVGALVPHKGQRFLVQAMPQVLHDVPEAHLIIFGEGELRSALERQVRELHLEKHVLLPGFRPDVLQLAKSADLFVMSSVTEGLGSTVLDAMAMQLAVVGTTAGGIPETVIDGQTGLLVPPGHAAPLAAAIVRLLKDPAARARMGQAGLSRVAEHFGVGRMLQRTVQAYRRAAEMNANTTSLNSRDQPSGSA
jgi:glycosyltransferase involved in cell wall biosynthesis